MGDKRGDEWPGPFRPAVPGRPMPVAGTLLLPERTLTVDGRVLPVLSGYDGSRRFAGPLTVAAKHASSDLAVGVPSKGPAEVAVPYVVELRDTQDQPLYVGTFTKALGLGDHKVTSDWIGLDADDAKWFYARIRVGDSISVTTATTPSATPSDRSRAASRAALSDGPSADLRRSSGTES